MSNEKGKVKPEELVNLEEKALYKVTVEGAAKGLKDMKMHPLKAATLIKKGLYKK